MKGLFWEGVLLRECRPRAAAGPLVHSQASAEPKQGRQINQPSLLHAQSPVSTPAQARRIAHPSAPCIAQQTIQFGPKAK